MKTILTMYCSVCGHENDFFRSKCLDLLRFLKEFLDKDETNKNLPKYWEMPWVYFFNQSKINFRLRDEYICWRIELGCRKKTDETLIRYMSWWRNSLLSALEYDGEWRLTEMWDWWNKCWVNEQHERYGIKIWFSVYDESSHEPQMIKPERFGRRK